MCYVFDFLFLYGNFARCNLISFKRMMIHKVFLLLMATMGLIACSMGHSVEKNDNMVSLDTAQLVNRVNEIYADVFNYYEQKASNQDATPRLTGVKPPSVRFCTRDWNDCVNRVTAYDSTHAQDGEMGFFDVDYWVMGQDYGDLSVSDVHVTSMTDSTATVELNLHNFGNVTAVRLLMSLDRNEWRIDDFIDMTNDFDWKASMTEYLSEDKPNH